MMGMYPILELARFRGHLYAYPKGVHDAVNETTLSRRIPQTNG